MHSYYEIIDDKYHKNETDDDRYIIQKDFGL